MALTDDRSACLMKDHYNYDVILNDVFLMERKTVLKNVHYIHLSSAVYVYN